MKNMSYFSTPRPGNKRGGGTAITAKGDRFKVTKLNINIPKPLEVVWCLLQPKTLVGGGVSKIILCSFYSPPNSRKKSALIDHLAITVNSLKIIHPKASFIIAGDKNDLNEVEICSICPSFRQIVQKPTRKKKTLTVVITDLHTLYQEPLIIPPVPVDCGEAGVPSDHQGVLALPVNSVAPPKSSKKTLIIRPIKDSSLRSFGEKIVLEDWIFLDPDSTPTSLVESFQKFCSLLIEEHFPLKTVNVSSHDLPYFTEQLRSLRRQRQREYRRHGRSEKYLGLKKTFDDNLITAAHTYKNKLIAEVMEGKRGSAYKAIKKLGNDGSSCNEGFEIPSHVESNMSAQQSAELLADYFSCISQEFLPLDCENFSPSLKLKIKSDETPPILEEFSVYKKICGAKKPNSTVPGDLPKKVVKNFAVELAKPLEVIFNAITKTAEYPRQWVVEHQTPIPKIYPPSSEDELRNISCTPFFSKVYEAFLSDWLMPIVEPFLDPANCGGLRGTSISHYLVRLLHFIHMNVDKAEPHAVVMAMIDLSKAFNRVDHTLVIEDLHDMHVPGWLLKILISYLTNRSMVLKYQGASSSPRSLPGSAPQGVFLGCFFFMVKFNGALLRPNVPRPFPPPEPLMFSKTTSCTVKYIDDASQARAINLRKTLLHIDTSNRPLPLEFSEHTGYILDPVKNELQSDLNNLKLFTDKNLMIINQKKTQIMKFNFRKTLDFPPIFKFDNRPSLGIVNETKILGIILSDSLKWSAHVSYMLKRAQKKIWTLRRMKLLKLDIDILVDFYCKEIRSILEFGVAVWNSGITTKMSEQLERIQRICINTILLDTGVKVNYMVACTLLNLEPLFYWRQSLCIKFIQKASQDPRHSDMFSRNNNACNTRANKPEYREFKCRNARFYNSPLCYLTRLLNNNPVKPKP